MDKALSLVTLLARSYHADAALDDIQARIDAGVDWEAVAFLIDHHRASALCLQTLAKLDQETVPPAFLRSLQAECTESTRNALALMNALHKLVALLQEQDIEFACFKGVVAAQLIYGQLSMRNFSDIDLFVRPSDHARTEQLLIDNGFRITHRYDGAFQSGLRDDKRRVNIDLHWGIPPQELGLDSHLLWDELSTLEIGNKAVPTFSFNDTLLLTAVNATKEYWESRLYRFCDLAELIQHRPQIDWNGIFRRANQLGCQRALFTALIVAHRLLAAPLPRDIAQTLGSHQALTPLVEELIAQIQQSHLVPEEEDNYRQTLYVKSDKHYFLMLQDNLSGRLRYWLHWALIPSAADREFVKLPKSLSGLYYLIRPVRLLLKRR